ncbi:TetR/AcrR family transcriptional regulator [Candidatus Desantisbacteria bacterium]|nr:TetR/AcrR family transcriptional regulator [Candidatus Desantisbacteria bacterium]
MRILIKEKKEQKYNAILNAGLEIFSSRGYHNTVIEEIAIKAGIGKGTIYRYFKNKKDLFLALIEYKVDELKVAVFKEISKQQGTHKRLEAGVCAYLKYFEKNKNFYQILIHEKSEFGKEAFLLHRRKQVDLFKPFIQEGINKGEIKSLNAGSLTYALFGFIDSLIWKWICSGTKSYPLSQELPIIVEIISSGIFKK